MKTTYLSVALVFSILISMLTMSSKSFSQNDSLTLEGPYLGQELPGLIPETFAPGIVSTKSLEVRGVFAPSMNEFYFFRRNDEEGNTHRFQYKNGRWYESIEEGISGRVSIAPDGRTMYLGNKYKKRIKSGWSEAENLGALFDKYSIMRLSASSKGTFVFDEVGSLDGDSSIRYSKLVGGNRQPPKKFRKEINTGKFNAHPFIAPDESYLIWDGQREGGYGDSDLYISFRQPNGTWSEAINLGEQINTDAWEAYANVTPDGKYLFFHRAVGPDDVDIFWVDAQIIESLRSKSQSKNGLFLTSEKE